MRLRARGFGPATSDARRLAPVVLAVALLGASCGRSAPEGANAELDPAEEPASAGIQVSSEAPVITPVATTTTTTTVAAAPAMEAGGSYIVEPGDTLSVIAERFGVSVDALSQANNITDVDSIRPGQELVIPAQG